MTPSFLNDRRNFLPLSEPNTQVFLYARALVFSD